MKDKEKMPLIIKDGAIMVGIFAIWAAVVAVGVLYAMYRGWL